MWYIYIPGTCVGLTQSTFDITDDLFQAVMINGSFGLRVYFEIWTTLAESINLL
jgi:hypothetical protein